MQPVTYFVVFSQLDRYTTMIHASDDNKIKKINKKITDSFWLHS